MSFVNAVQKCLSNYITLSGRAQRSEYWWFTLFCVLVSVAAMILDNDVEGVIQGIVGLALLLPSISVAVRRLHDLDRTGWWILILVIPIIGPIILLIFACTRGTYGDNRFGPDPLRPDEGDAMRESG